MHSNLHNEIQSRPVRRLASYASKWALFILFASYAAFLAYCWDTDRAMAAEGYATLVHRCVETVRAMNGGLGDATYDVGDCASDPLIVI